MLLSRLKIALSVVAAVIVSGIAGYMIIEGWSFKDAFFMTIITITTVGFSEVHPLSAVGQYFTMFLVIAGTGTAFYLLLSVTEFMIEGHLTGLLAERKVEKEIKKLSGHYIVCGFGKVGVNVVTEFVAAKADFVVIENNPERVTESREHGYYCIEGDASSDEVLLAAGVERAKGLIAALDNDADNVFVTLTARVLNPSIYIVARNILEESKEKLLRAGANKVLSPSFIGGKRMATMMMRPLVSDFLDVVSVGDGLEFRLEELSIEEKSICDGCSLGDIDIRKITGAVVLAIKKPSGEFNTNPTAETVLEPGDHLVVLGTQEQLDNVLKIV